MKRTIPLIAIVIVGVSLQTSHGREPQSQPMPVPTGAPVFINRGQALTANEAQALAARAASACPAGADEKADGADEWGYGQVMLVTVLAIGALVGILALAA